MKRKYFLVVLFLILAISLSGCGIITDEEKVRDVIDEYFLALNDQDWDKAKNYCIYESEAYYETCLLETHIDSLYPSVVVIDCQLDIFDIVITGNCASAYVDGVFTITTDDNPVTSDFSEYFYLQKISNNWKLDYR